jgi:hypothetical protein
VAALVGGFAPVALLDRWLLAPTGGNWISLDFRGLLIAAYAIWLTFHVVATTVAVAVPQLQRHSVRAIHAVSAVAVPVALAAAIKAAMVVDAWLAR